MAFPTTVSDSEVHIDPCSISLYHNVSFPTFLSQSYTPHKQPIPRAWRRTDKNS